MTICFVTLSFRRSPNEQQQKNKYYSLFVCVSVCVCVLHSVDVSAGFLCVRTFFPIHSFDAKWEMAFIFCPKIEICVLRYIYRNEMEEWKRNKTPFSANMCVFEWMEWEKKWATVTAAATVVVAKAATSDWFISMRFLWQLVIFDINFYFDHVCMRCGVCVCVFMS